LGVVDDTKVVVREISTAGVVQSRLPGTCSVLIKVLEIPAAPQEWLLTTGSIVLGAGRGADLVIGDDSVSRKHLQVTLSNQGIEVVDLNSSNGTYYQGQRIGRLALDREATFVLGRVKITIVPQVNVEASPDAETTRYGSLLGVSTVMRHLFSNLVQLEQSSVPLLIEGENGSGKQLMAREIHEHSPVHEGPFIAVNCESLEPQWIRSELFGSSGGSPATTDTSKAGAIERAQGGTLFLNDVSELPAEVQPSLLAALEKYQVVRMGEIQESPANVRIIAASRRNLAHEVSAGRFREDLYYRLKVVVLRIPALRERQPDVCPLAQHFASEHGVLRLPPQVIEQLERHTWPGNVRELRNVIRGYAAVGELPQAPIENDNQLAEMLRRVLDVERPYQQQKDHILNNFLDVYLSMLLEHTGGNQSQASRMSGIERAHLNRMIAKLRGDSKRTPSGTLEAVDNTAPHVGKRPNSSLPRRSR
jgi:DNA-binding NtrC family response regulator